MTDTVIMGCSLPWILTGFICTTERKYMHAKILTPFRIDAMFVFLIVLLPLDIFAQDLSGAGSDQEEQTGQEETPPHISPQNYEVLVEDSVSYRPSLNTVATKFPTSLQATPASVSVVTAPLFKVQNATVLGDALRNVSGVAAHKGSGVYDFFTIRGFDSLSSGLVLTDSASEPEVTFYHLYNIERVEVLKGPGAFLYGGNPLSGSVNLVRKQPLFEDALELGGMYGSFQTYAGNLDLNRTSSDGKLAFRLNLFGQNSDFYRDDKNNHQVAINPALTWMFSNNSAVTLNFEYVNVEYKSDSGLPISNNQLAAVPRTNSYQSPFDISDQEIFRFRADFNHSVNDSLTVRNKFYYTDLDWKSNGTLFSGVFPSYSQPGVLDVHRILTRLDDRQKLVGNQFEGLFSFTTGEVSHNLLIGFELSRLGDKFTLDVDLLPTIGLSNPIETAAKPLYTIPGQSLFADSHSLVYAPYVMDQVTFSERFQLFLGGRLDVIDYDDPLTATHRNKSQFSPLAGLIYSPQSEVSVYVNGGKAFAPPSSTVVGDRQPEESLQYEIGIKKQFLGGKMDTTLAFYHLERNNISIPDQFGVARQTGDQRSRGIEIEYTAEAGPGWYILGSYAFNKSELTEFREQIVVSMAPYTAMTFDRSGNDASFAPPHLFSFWTVKEFLNGISISGGGRYVSDQFIAEDNVFKINSVFTLDATLSYRFQKWLWSLNIKNITNRDYETRGFGKTSVIPANPVALYGRMEFSL